MPAPAGTRRPPLRSRHARARPRETSERGRDPSAGVDGETGTKLLQVAAARCETPPAHAPRAHTPIAVSANTRLSRRDLARQRGGAGSDWHAPRSRPGSMTGDAADAGAGRRQPSLPQRAVEQLRAVAKPWRVRVRIDAEGFPIIPGRYAQIEWFDGRDLAVYTNCSRLLEKLWAVPGVKRAPDR